MSDIHFVSTTFQDQLPKWCREWKYRTSPSSSPTSSPRSWSSPPFRIEPLKCRAWKCQTRAVGWKVKNVTRTEITSSAGLDIYIRCKALMLHMCQLHFFLLGRRSPEQYVEYEKNSQWRKRGRARWVFTESPLCARHSQGAHYSRFWNSGPLFSWNNVVTILYYFLHIHIFTILLQFSLSLFNTGRPLFSFQPPLVLDLLFVTRSSVERQLFKSFLVWTLEVRFPNPLVAGSEVVGIKGGPQNTLLFWSLSLYHPS